MAVVADGQSIGELGEFEGRMFAAHAKRYGEMTQCAEPHIVINGDELHVHPENYMTLFERCLAAPRDYSYEWLTLGVQIAEGITGYSRTWYIVTDGLPLLPLQYSTDHVPVHGKGFELRRTRVGMNMDPWLPTRYPDPRWDLRPPLS